MSSASPRAAYLTHVHRLAVERPAASSPPSREEISLMLTAIQAQQQQKVAELEFLASAAVCLKGLLQSDQQEHPPFLPTRSLSEQKRAASSSQPAIPQQQAATQGQVDLANSDLLDDQQWFKSLTNSRHRDRQQYFF
jgi:hypothetical protein